MLCQNLQSVSSLLDYPHDELKLHSPFNHNTTAGSDYVETTVLLTFAPLSSPQQCADVTILDNTIFEGEEMFSAQLLPTDGTTIVLDPGTATVTITDEDSMCNAQ